jgi:hypothetical protein
MVTTAKKVAAITVRDVNPRSMSDERRDHERIDIQMPTRIWLAEEYKGKPIEFEGHARTRNIAIGGTFLESSYLLPLGFPVNLEIHLDPGEALVARGEVVHTVSFEESATESGMGVIFTEVDAENRERLLRFFVSDRIREFYTERFIVEFPHLANVLSLQDVALVLNLWEDRDNRLMALKKSVPTQVTAGKKKR